MIAPALHLHQVQTSVAHPSDAAAVEIIAGDMRDIEFDDGDKVYPHFGVHLVQRSPALLRRFKLLAVLLRVDRDPQLQRADLDDIKKATANGETVFDASAGLSDGIALLDAYLAPLLGALSPRVWAFSASRTSGTIVYTLGRTIPGVMGGAVEPLSFCRLAKAPTSHPYPTYLPTRVRRR